MEIDGRHHRGAIVFQLEARGGGGYTARAKDDGIVVEGDDLVVVHESIRRAVAAQVPEGRFRSIRVVFPSPD